MFPMGGCAQEFPELERQLDLFATLRESADEPRRIFNEVDIDGSGTLDQAEAAAMLRSLGTVAEKDMEAQVQAMG